MIGKTNAGVGGVETAVLTMGGNGPSSIAYIDNKLVAHTTETYPLETQLNVAKNTIFYIDNAIKANVNLIKLQDHAYIIIGDCRVFATSG